MYVVSNILTQETHVSRTGSVNYCLCVKAGPSPTFINKAVLECICTYSCCGLLS